MSTYSMNGVAGGTVHVSRAVHTSNTSEGSLSFVEAADNTVEPSGISDEASRATGIGSDDVTIAATVGQPLKVYGLGNTALVKVGVGGTTAGTRVRVVSVGTVRSLAGTELGGTWTLGIAQETRLVDEYCKVFVDPQRVVYAQS